jgi:hypothetical protein
MAYGALRFLRESDHELEPSGVAMVRLQRMCLNCRVSFDSAWAGERVCSRCKARTAWRNGASTGPSNSSQSVSRSGRKGAS